MHNKPIFGKLQDKDLQKGRVHFKSPYVSSCIVQVASSDVTPAAFRKHPPLVSPGLT